jgi:hypothetical protein
MATGGDEQQNEIKFSTVQVFLKDLDQDGFLSIFSYTHSSNTQKWNCATTALCYY